MDPGNILIWFVLAVYIIIVIKMKIMKRKEWKWMLLLILGAIGCSVLVAKDISFNHVTDILNETFGKLSKMVVKI